MLSSEKPFVSRFLLAMILLVSGVIVFLCISTTEIVAGCECTSEYAEDPKWECCGTGPDESCGCARCGSPSCSTQYDGSTCTGISCGSDDPAPTPVPTCTFNYNDITLYGVGDEKVITTSSISLPAGSKILSTAFNLVSGENIASFNPNPIVNGTTITTVRGEVIGGTSIYSAHMSLDIGISCSDTLSVNIDVPPAWCQIKEGDLIVGHSTGETNASVIIPVFPGSYLMNYDTGGYPGIPVAARSISTLPGGISTPFNWKVENDAYAGELPSYTRLKNKISRLSDISDSGDTLDQFEITHSGTEFPAGSGYHYFTHIGDVSLQEGSVAGGTINISNRRVIVFVDGNVYINSKLLLNKGVGLFILIASGDIYINKAVGGADDFIPDLEGIYVADKNFVTETEGIDLGADKQLHVRGVVIAGGSSGFGVRVQRNLAYPDIPSEIFEYGVDQTMLFPPALSDQSMIWKEVLP